MGESTIREELAAGTQPQTAVEEAIARARRYADTPLAGVERCRVLRAVGVLLRARSAELVELMAEQIRKPVALGGAEVARSAEAVEWTASEWETMRGELVPTQASESGDGRLIYVKRRPVGVVCAITLGREGPRSAIQTMTVEQTIAIAG